MRIVLDIILILSVLFWPWYITALLMFLGMIFFNRFYEVFVAAVLMDSLYYVPVESFVGSWIMTISVSIAYVVIYFVQSRIRT